jgi:soluble lytic murein transglycosylase-like protein
MVQSSFCARVWRSSWPLGLGSLVLCAGLGALWPARDCLAASAKTSPVQPSAQQDPELRSVVQQAIQQARCFADAYDSAVWFKLMEPKLRRYVKDDPERLEILQTVYCETHRDGVSLLPPGLVMAVLDVESGFDRWAVSSAGAVGLMQVMPFWPEQLGMRRYELTRIAANVSMGCAILRYYLESERRDVRRALERYNGSIGRREYPDRVIVRWTTYWNGADDLGRQSANRS